jgi:hypothetical protein
MKRSFLLKLLFLFLLTSCSPYFFLPDQYLEFTESQKINYSFHDTVNYKDQSNLINKFKLSRFYFGKLGHTLTGTDYKGAQAYCDYEFMTFCKISEPITCESIYSADTYLKKDLYGGPDWVDLRGYIKECNKCFTVIKYMSGDREKDGKLKAVLFWNDTNKHELNTDVKITEIELNGRKFYDVYKTDIYCSQTQPICATL